MRLPDRNIAALLMIYRKINAWRSEHAAPLGLSSMLVGQGDQCMERLTAGLTPEEKEELGVLLEKMLENTQL